MGRVLFYFLIAIQYLLANNTVYDFLHCYYCGEKPIQESVQTPSQEKCSTAETVRHKHVSETMNLVAIARNYDRQMPFM